jgi:hypothetical protein
MSEKTGTFLVTAFDEESAVFRDVHDAQVHTIDQPPDLGEGDVVSATIEPVPPMDVVWSLRELDERRTIELVDSDLEPTTQAGEIAADQPVGEVTRVERAGTGEVHVLSTPADEVEATASDVLSDEETLARAARLDATRVEVRTGPDFLSVRYLPD